jgi:SAM-dependent methyltransferase
MSTTTVGVPLASGLMARAIEVTAPPEPLAASAVGEWFEAVYRDSRGDAAAVPWADLRPNPMMVAWLNAEAPGLIRPGSRVAVVGCGLGDDVSELACRGYDAVGFDVSHTAVEWARRRFPSLSAAMVQADLLALPSRLLRRFDLVIENYTLQALPPACRERAARAVASMACPRGHVLAVCTARGEDEPLETVSGPPWPLTASELSGLMEQAGMRPARPVEDFLDDDHPPVRRLRGLFSR